MIAIPALISDYLLDFKELLFAQSSVKQQGASPVTDFDSLLGDFWPEDESADDFIATVRRWRHEEERESKVL